VSLRSQYNLRPTDRYITSRWYDRLGLLLMKDKDDKAALQEAINVVRSGLNDEFTQLRMYNTRSGGNVDLSNVRQAIVRASVVGWLA
jgi:hypothetical protein